MEKGSVQTFLQRKYTNGQQAPEKMLTSLAIREMQNKATVRYHFTTTRMTIIKRDNKHDKAVEKSKPSYTADGNVKWYSHFGK